MIVGVLNGYYRSGTTIWQRIIEESSPHLVTIHEPAGPATGREVLQRVEVNPIHGWDAYRGYYRLPRHIFREFVRRWHEVFTEPKGIMTDWSDVKYLLEPFHDCDVPIFIKSNQLHLFLDRIERHFKTKCIHITRNLADNIYAHLEIYPCEHYKRRVLLSKEFPSMFFVDYVYRDLKEYFNEPQDAENVLQKLVYNITKCNEVANCIKVPYEDFEATKNAIKSIGLNVDKADELFISRVDIAPPWLKKMLEVEAC